MCKGLCRIIFLGVFKMEDKTIRSRNWFLTINENCSCFDNLVNIVKAEKTNHYALIKHYKEDNLHYHLCIEFENAKTFTAVQSIFEGAHIELMKYKNVSYQYLIHKNESDKEPYDISEVITDNIDYYTLMVDSDQFEHLNTENIMSDISSGYDSIMKFIQKYGLNQVNMYHNLITKLINENRENLKRDFAKLENEKIELYKKIDDLTTENELLWEVLEKNNLVAKMPIQR